MKHKFYVTLEVDWDDPDQVAEGMKELLYDGGCGPTGLKNIVIIPWQDTIADFKAAMAQCIVKIPGLPEVPERKREKIE
jgi:hypothetical protein